MLPEIRVAGVGVVHLIFLIRRIGWHDITIHGNFHAKECQSAAQVAEPYETRSTRQIASAIIYRRR